MTGESLKEKQMKGKSDRQEETRELFMRLLTELKDTVCKVESPTCEIFQAVISQLELDTAQDTMELSLILSTVHDRVHTCLACNPCPTNVLFDGIPAPRISVRR